MTETTFTVKVKWQKQVFPSIQIDTSEPPELFKSQLWTLTGVPPSRQTILGLKGGKLKDDTDWSRTGLKNNMTLMLMGTPDGSMPPPPKDMPVVHDDLDAEYTPLIDIAPVGPPGLANLGNTCYMNASVQCLAAVGPLVKALRRYAGRTSASDPGERLSANLRDVVGRLKDGKGRAVDPSTFLRVLRQVNPQFAERGQTGLFMQQDAEECWGEILMRLAGSLRVGEGNWVDKLFGIKTKAVDRCVDSDEVVERREEVRALKCHISLQVNHLVQGVREGLEETIEKQSERLGRSAEWKRTVKLDDIPPFVIVQFVRFFWKPTEGVKAKILRNVSFPVVLDVYEFCTEELQGRLREKRDAALASGEGGEVKEEGGEEKDEGELVAETGHYELCAVLTHQGRAADAGHYVAWVKDQGSKWFKFDDDKVSIHNEEEVKKLSGGGDWHMAYMCIYRAMNNA